MPRTSERARKVNRYRKWFKQRIKLLLLREAASDADDSDREMVDAAIGTAYSDVKSRRYYIRDASYKKASITYDVLDDCYNNYSDDNFLLHFLIHRDSFVKLHRLLCGYCGFHRK